MIIAKVTINQAERAAYLLQTEGGHDEAADALLSLANDTDLVMTRDGADDAETERLLSAAPDMLAALTAMVAWNDSDNARGEDIDWDGFDAAMGGLRAAIAKAEGRADG